MSQAARQQFDSIVQGNTPLCRDHFRLILRVNGFPPSEPGQFIQILCRNPRSIEEIDEPVECNISGWPTLQDHELDSPQAMLRRPFSLAGRYDRADATDLHIIHRVVGVGTNWLAKLEPGNEVNILGPLGNTFTMPAPSQRAILVGGGVGIPPMLYLAEKLAGRAIAFCGATTADLLPLTRIRSAVTNASDPGEPSPIIEEFARHSIPSVVSTDDGTFGFKGFVTEALERYLDSLRSPLAPSPSPLSIYTCGPEPMMRRVAQIALERGIECQIAVERAMACGMGTCQSCCIRVRKPDPSQVPLPGSEWCYRLACTDGPIFRAADLLW